jgi:hypothetical protein
MGTENLIANGPQQRAHPAVRNTAGGFRPSAVVVASPAQLVGSAALKSIRIYGRIFSFAAFSIENRREKSRFRRLATVFCLSKTPLARCLLRSISGGGCLRGGTGHPR